jgi:putative nucleotidyltransferase with HDIG domain
MSDFGSLQKDLKTEVKQGVVTLFNAEDDFNSVKSVYTKFLSIINEIVGNNDIISSKLKALKNFDDYTFRHSINVATLAGIVAESINSDENYIKNVIIACLLHDIGKIKVPVEVLNKKGRLTKEEFEFIQRHPKDGFDLIQSYDTISDESKHGILEHHENMDGTGYPSNLCDDSISKIARLISIVDVYTALVSDRPFRLAMKPVDALNIMFTMTNRFDQNIFNAFLRVVIVFPNNSNVVTSNGSCYTVVSQNSGYPLRPTIKNTETDEVIDLAHDYENMSMIITEFVY